MISLVSYPLTLLACLIGVPVAVLFFEVVAAIVLPSQKYLQWSAKGPRQRVAVIVPAHNESSGLVPTITDIRTQLRAGDRLLVVADNCIDDTASVAEAGGAEVIKRDDPTRLGKGYALDFALKHVSQDPPAVVIIIDADCRISEDAIDQLALASATTQRPVQAIDIQKAQDDSPINFRVAEFAWRVKNWVRPLGLNVLNLPCQLMGTGMAFPWGIVRSAQLANPSIVEDLKLGLDLARAGSPPLFCSVATVTSYFPTSAEGAKSQRERWERGHISMMTMVPRLIFDALARGDIKLLALALDLAVPPLSLLVILLAAMLCISGLAMLLGTSSTALIITATCVLAVALAIFLAWLRYGRDLLPSTEMYLVVSYILGKFPIYRRFFGGAAMQWTRTDRHK